MWILMAVTVFLAWVYPFQLLLRMQQHEIVLPSVLAVLIFWGIYACVDVCLYASDLLGELRSWLVLVWQKRAFWSVERKRLSLWSDILLNPAACTPEVLSRVSPQKPAQAMILVGPLVIAQDPAFKNVALGWLKSFFPSDALRWLVTAYTKIQAHDLAFDVAKEHFFKGKVPVWMHSWTLDVYPSVNALSQCDLPQTLPHRSWHPWLKRIGLAAVLRSESIDVLQQVLEQLPVSWRKEKKLQWAVLERIHVMGWDKRKEAVALMSGYDAGLLALYAEVYALDKLFFWQWKAVVTQFEACQIPWDQESKGQGRIQLLMRMMSDQTEGSAELVIWARQILRQCIELTVQSERDLSSA